MKEFSYVVTEAEGLHIRPAGMLVKLASKYQSDIWLIFHEKKVSAKRVFAIMGLAVKCGGEVSVQIEGPDEEQAYEDILALFQNHL